MGYLTVIGNCIACGKTFTFNASLVPSIRIHGTREPVCRECIETANAKRRATGLPELEILPGAYDPVETP